ncbi:MAG: helix-turn-helix transcriptional regulator [Acidaminococcaceae bacterium]|mgnify:CR=1 FL=1|nr:helix-turn-helix transcriptional regulator [Acidaminococcaceae bacterium]
MEERLFGDFLHAKRIERGVSYRELADAIGITAPYLSDIEKNRRNAPPIDKLEKIAVKLSLSPKDRMTLFDLAGQTKKTIAPDIPKYIMEKEYVAVALRKARDLQANKSDWDRFIKELENKRKGK